MEYDLDELLPLDNFDNYKMKHDGTPARKSKFSESLDALTDDAIDKLKNHLTESRN